MYFHKVLIYHVSQISCLVDFIYMYKCIKMVYPERHIQLMSVLTRRHAHSNLIPCEDAQHARPGPVFCLLLRLCSANHRAGYWSNLPCDWPSIAWTYSKQETENGPWGPTHSKKWRFLDKCIWFISWLSWTSVHEARRFCRDIGTDVWRVGTGQPCREPTNSFSYFVNYLYYVVHYIVSQIGCHSKHIFTYWRETIN